MFLTCSSDTEITIGEVSIYRFKLNADGLFFTISGVESLVVKSSVTLKKIFFMKFCFVFVFKLKLSKFKISSVHGKL